MGLVNAATSCRRPVAMQQSRPGRRGKKQQQRLVHHSVPLFERFQINSQTIPSNCAAPHLDSIPHLKGYRVIFSCRSDLSAVAVFVSTQTSKLVARATIDLLVAHRCETGTTIFDCPYDNRHRTDFSGKSLQDFSRNLSAWKQPIFVPALEARISSN